METYIPELDGFVRLHAPRIHHLPGSRQAHMAVFTTTGVSLDCGITPYSTEDILASFDRDHPLVRRVLQQIATHDVNTEKVLGLHFGGNNMLCHVVTCQKKP